MQSSILEGGAAAETELYVTAPAADQPDALPEICAASAPGTVAELHTTAPAADQPDAPLEACTTDASGGVAEFHVTAPADHPDAPLEACATEAPEAIADNRAHVEGGMPTAAEEKNGSEHRRTGESVKRELAAGEENEQQTQREEGMAGPQAQANVPGVDDQPCPEFAKNDSSQDVKDLRQSGVMVEMMRSAPEEHGATHISPRDQEQVETDSSAADHQLLPCAVPHQELGRTNRSMNTSFANADISLAAYAGSECISEGKGDHRFGGTAAAELGERIAEAGETTEADMRRRAAPWHIWPDNDLPALLPEKRQQLRVFCGVWNLHGKQAPPDLDAWLVTDPKHHLYVIGTCECERSIGMSLLWASKARWEQQVRSHLGEDYLMAGAHNMSAIHIMVFVHRLLWRYSWDIRTDQVATGFADLVGNKGGTHVGLSIGRTSLLFMHAHLAAHEGRMKERTQSLARILTDSPMRRKRDGAGIHEEFDRVFFMGDLNSRLEVSRDRVDAWLAGNELDKCLEHDQLLPLLRATSDAPALDGAAGMWPLFEEATIRFPPTYKFDVHTDNYDSSKKQRVPSWTDRILWKRDKEIRPVSYNSIPEFQCSDHKPIFAQFEVSVDLDDWDGPTLGPDKGSVLKSGDCSKSSVVCVLQ